MRFINQTIISQIFHHCFTIIPALFYCHTVLCLLVFWFKFAPVTLAGEDKSFNVISSVEMAEHVGIRSLGAWRTSEATSPFLSDWIEDDLRRPYGTLFSDTISVGFSGSLGPSWYWITCPCAKARLQTHIPCEVGSLRQPWEQASIPFWKMIHMMRKPDWSGLRFEGMGLNLQ